MTNTDNPEWPPLAESAASIDASLKDFVGTANAIAEALTLIDDELSQLRRSAFPPRPILAAGETGYPWAPGTMAQGFLGGRWERRDGTSYGAATTTGGDNRQGKTYSIRAGRRQRHGARSDH